MPGQGALFQDLRALREGKKGLDVGEAQLLALLDILVGVTLSNSRGGVFEGSLLGCVLKGTEYIPTYSAGSGLGGSGNYRRILLLGFFG